MYLATRTIGYQNVSCQYRWLSVSPQLCSIFRVSGEFTVIDARMTKWFHVVRMSATSGFRVECVYDRSPAPDFFIVHSGLYILCENSL